MLVSIIGICITDHHISLNLVHSVTITVVH